MSEVERQEIGDRRTHRFTFLLRPCMALYNDGESQDGQAKTKFQKMVGKSQEIPYFQALEEARA